jgi:hypothetical protein
MTFGALVTWVTGAKSATESYGSFLVQRGADEMRIAYREQRIAVGRRFGDLIGADGRARAGPVVDDDLVTERVGQFLRKYAARHVGRAPGGKRHDEPDWPVRVVLRAHGRRNRRGRNERSEQAAYSVSRKNHFFRSERSRTRSERGL